MILPPLYVAEQAAEQHLVPVDFPPVGAGILVPAGCRVLRIQELVVRVPGPNGTTRIYIHPDDVETVKARNVH